MRPIPNFAGLFAVVMFTTSAGNSAIYEDIYSDSFPDDSYGYYDDKEGELQNTSTTYATTNKIKTTAYFYDTPRIRDECPLPCYCSSELKVVDCSNRNLTEIPANIPRPALRIDLSSNLIEEISDDDFEQCSNAQEIILHTNKIQRINKKVFTNLKELKNIDLAKNSLTYIAADMFMWADNLKSINFSHNHIKFGEVSFLNFPKLQQLLLQGCQIQKLADNIFQNLSGLLFLDLQENEFEVRFISRSKISVFSSFKICSQTFNVKAFTPLVELQELKLPNTSKHVIQELCNLLVSVDSISFGKQSISCFVLVSGGSFEQSVIHASQNIKVKLKTVIPTRGTTQIQTVSVATELTITSEEYSGAISRKESRSNSPSKQISASAINKILIGIIVFAALGLTIGIIRRKNFCGLRTKLCRSRRLATTDLIQPADAAPLNKV